MTYKLGIDTGGTYTDAVILDKDNNIIDTRKALTTHHDLFIGIEQAAGELLKKHQDKASQLSLVGLSTTLATNAIVENHGLPACLVLIGQPPQILQRAKLAEALAHDPVIFIDGGHKASGEMAKELDEAKLIEQVNAIKNDITAVAIAGYFAVRNSTHEMRAREIIREHFDLPVTCSHELSSQLDAPRRALTCLLNARLIPLLTNLIHAVESLLDLFSIKAPIMVVQTDGSLINAEQALLRPIETILSGPAASLHGAKTLSGIETGLVSDIGGTTTDVAMLENGFPLLDKKGATIGGWNTLVNAVAVHTVGLGGDSEATIKNNGSIELGPQRAIPLSLLPNYFDAIEKQLKQQTEDEALHYDGRFAIAIEHKNRKEIFTTTAEQEIYERLKKQPLALSTLFSSPSYGRAFERLRKRGLVRLSSFTPSDACHVLGLQDNWHKNCALLGATLLARQYYQITGTKITPVEIAQKVFQQVIDASSLTLIESLLRFKQNNISQDKINYTKELFSQSLIKKSTSQNDYLGINISANIPVIAIGAPAYLYYQQVGEQLATSTHIPKHADVCNAVGAITSKVIRHCHVLITSPNEEKFRVHIEQGISDFEALDQAYEFAMSQSKVLATQAVIDAGGDAKNITIKQQKEDNIIKGSDGFEIFLESKISAIASAEPKV